MLDADDLLYVLKDLPPDAQVIVILDGVAYRAGAAICTDEKIEIMVDPLDEIDESDIGSEELI